MGSMNLEEFLKTWAPETNPSPSPGIEPGTAKIVDDDVWRDIRGSDGDGDGVEDVKREPSMGEMTLEDFLTKEGAIDDYPLIPMAMDIGSDDHHCFSHQISLSPAPSVSDTPPQTFEVRGVEKKLKRKIKNRESAARSRARKQAYHNELVSKVSLLEEQNMRLKKEKELEDRLFKDFGDEPRYQLRRTSSTIF